MPGNEEGNNGQNQGNNAIQLPALPENWIQGLDADLQKEESLKLFKDVPSLVKSYVHAQKQVGVDKIPVPNPKYATDEDWQKVYQKLGLPDKIDDYKIEVSKDLGFEGDRLKEYTAAAHKAGILPKQLQQMMKWHEDDTKKVLNQAQEKMKQDGIQAEANLKQEWGQAYEKNMAQAKFTLKTLNDPKLVEFLDKSKMGDHPEMIKVFSKIGEMLGEKKVQGLGDEIGKYGNVRTPEVARREISSIQGNMTHPYNDAKHPSHYMAVKDMESLFQQAYPHVEVQAR